MINPVNRCLTKEGADRYGAEPYVMAADVYSNPEFLGRAGWSYYTGSAAWMYKTAVEQVLGLKKQGDKLYIEPKAPATWKEFSVNYGGKIFIKAVNTGGKSKRILVDGVKSNLDYILLDGTEKDVIAEF